MHSGWTGRFALNIYTLRMFEALDNQNSMRIVRGPMFNSIDNVFATATGTRPHGIRASRLRAVPVAPTFGATMR